MNPKNPNHLFPLFVIEDLETTKRYYVDKLGFEVRFDLPSYLQVHSTKSADSPALCFMKPDAFPDGVRRPTFGGAGVVVSIPVDDADAAHDRMKARGAQLTSAPSDKPWGWRSYLALDPNGVALDFFHVYKDDSAGGM